MPLAPSTIAPMRFSTVGLPARARDRAVRELRERGLLPMEPLRGCTLQASLTKWFLPGASVLTGALSGLRQDGGPRARDASDDLFLGVNLTGGSVATQDGREVTLRQGDAILLSDAGGPFTLTRPTEVRFVGVRVPRRTVAPLMLEAESAAMRLIPRGTEAVTLMTRYIGAVLDARVLASTEVCHAVVSHLHDLVALSAGATRDGAAMARAGGARAARLQAIKADIAANLVDETLAVATVAARHGVTPRYVHKLFEDEGVTYSQFVLQHRLDRAFRMLRDPRCAARRISEIAYDMGFGDLSYFNRAFRRRYGATPSEIRETGQGGETPRPR
jgi:AraC-like DNA-binding protein